MADSAASLYAPRVPVFPRRVSGRFRRLKWQVMAVTLGIYYLTPWLRWDRGPEMPSQAVLVDLAGRRFFFGPIEIWPHEFWVVAGLLVMAGLGLFLFTSALGRVWCGYACPQTVWTDLFLLTERWVEGDRNARVRLWEAPWSPRKARLRLTKWAIWLVIAAATGGAWVFYFADAPTLLRELVTGQAHPVAYTTVAILTATTFFFGGIAREQVCIYACPWPRIQSAMLDEETLTVGYRAWRGEPRGKGRRAAAEAVATVRAAGPALGRAYAPTPLPRQPGGPRPGDAALGLGDCVDCLACVNVCPMGIDIRNGQQMECITCALCIDACDEVMDKLGRPRGLVGYFTLTDERAERAGGTARPVWRHVLRPRTLLYTALWSAAGLLILVGLLLRPEVELALSPVRNPLSVTLSDGTVRDTYDLRIRNRLGETRTFRVSAEGAALAVEGAEAPLVTVPPDALGHARLYVEAPPGSALAEGASSPLTVTVTDLEGGAEAARQTTFSGRGS